jgi:MFS family permease
MLWCVCLLNYADRQAIYSVFSVLGQEFRLSDVQLGVVAGCFMWAYAACGPVAGWVSDRVSRPRLIVLALCFWSVCTGATAFAHGYRSLLWLRMLGGAGEAFYFPAAMSLLAAYHGQVTRSRAMAVHQSSVYVGTIAGGALSAYLAERAGWRVGFEAFGAAGVLLAGLLLAFLRDPAKPVEEEAALPSEGRPEGDIVRNLMALARNKAALVMIAVFMGANFVAVVFLVWMPTFLQRKFNMHLGAAGLNGTVYVQAASVAGVIAGGFLADFLRRRTPGGRQLVQAAGLLGGVGFLFFVGHSVTVTALFVSMTGFGLFKGLYDANIWASLYDFVPTTQRGLATGVMNSLGWLGAGFAPVAFALASRRYGPGACVSMTSGIYLVLAVPLLLLAAKRGRRRAALAGAAA